MLLARGAWSQYLEVGLGPDAEIFTKAQPMSAVGSGAMVAMVKVGVSLGPIDGTDAQSLILRADTALLRAFYGGHLAVAQRLVQAGASLQARNRWDWGPVHMAAQSGCVPCLDWLKEQGQSLTEPAPASRGETPAMLAAAKGRIPVLEWLEQQRVDLWGRDPHGKNVLDWARFRQQQETEQWLLKRQPAGT